MIIKCILSMYLYHRFITLSSPYSQFFTVCNGNLRFPDWIQNKSFDWWSPETVGILLFQRSPFFSYPAYATPGGRSQQRSMSEGLCILHKLYLWSSTAQVQIPSEWSARVLCLPEYMPRRVCDRSLVCEERSIWCSAVYLSGLQTSIVGILET